MRYFSSVSRLDTQSARYTTSSGVRKPTISMQWPGSGSSSTPSGSTSAVRYAASLSWAMRNLCRSSLGGQPPYSRDGSSTVWRVKAHSAPGAYTRQPVWLCRYRHKFLSVLVAAAVDEAHVRVVQPHKADLGGTLHIVAAAGHLYQFVHRRTLLPRFLSLYGISQGHASLNVRRSTGSA